MATSSGAHNGPTTATDDPATVVRSFLAALEALDAAAAVDMVADDILYHNKGLPAVRGKVQFERAMGLLARYCDGFEAHIENLAVDGDTVLTERVDVLRVGRVSAELWVCGTFEIRDGKIVLWRDYFDFVNATVGLVRGVVRAMLDR